ncbi:MAG: hypothetical protein ACM3ZE_26990, partial [Myxococcales bacterium]
PGIERDIRICTSKAVREELYQVWVDLSILDIHGVPTLTQSPSDLQLPPPGIHAPDETAQSLGAPSLAASHRPEQHSADAEQATPLALQIPVAPRQMPKSQRELQHSLCDVQACPIAEQLADMPIVDALMVDVPMVDAPPGDWEETPAVPSGCWLAQFVGQT